MNWRDVLKNPEDVEKRISLTGNRCENPNCMARVENEGDVCDKCKRRWKNNELEKHN